MHIEILRGIYCIHNEYKRLIAEENLLVKVSEFLFEFHILCIHMYSVNYTYTYICEVAFLSYKTCIYCIDINTFENYYTWF